MSRVTDTLRSLAIIRGRLADPPGCLEHGFLMTCDDTFDLYLRIPRQGTFDECMGGRESWEFHRNRGVTKC